VMFSSRAMSGGISEVLSVTMLTMMRRRNEVLRGQE
jgi:hypothetical protein